MWFFIILYLFCGKIKKRGKFWEGRRYEGLKGGKYIDV